MTVGEPGSTVPRQGTSFLEDKNAGPFIALGAVLLLVVAVTAMVATQAVPGLSEPSVRVIVSDTTVTMLVVGALLGLLSLLWGTLIVVAQIQDIRDRLVRRDRG